MSKARQQANLSSDGNLFADISNDRVGIGSVVPTHKLHVAGTSKFDNDVKFEGTTAALNIDWDKSANTLNFSDNTKLTFGDATNGDFGIYHDASNSYLHRIAGGTGDIYVKLGGDNAIVAKTDNSVELYWDNSKKFETLNTGAKVTGNLEVTGVLTYDDVTSVDSVGIITSRTYIKVNSTQDQQLTLNSTDDGPVYMAFQRSGTRKSYFGFGGSNDRLYLANEISDGDIYITGNDGGSTINCLTFDVSAGGNATFLGDITIPDKIIHAGDTDTAIRFAGTDIVTVETGGSECLRVDTTGTRIPDKLLHFGDPDTMIRFPADNNISFETAGSEALRIDSNQRVMIGSTSSGGWKFRVQVPANASYQSAVNFTNNVNADLQFEIKNSESRLGSSTNTPLVFKTNNTERLNISSSAVAASGVVMRANDGFVSDTNLIFNSDHNANNSTNDSIIFKNAGTERVRIKGNGNTGIGTASPQERLHLYAGNCALEVDAPANRYCSIGFSVDGASKWWMGRGDSDILSETSFFIGKDAGNASDKGGNSAHFVITSTGHTKIDSQVNALTDLSTSANYHLHLSNPANDAGEAVGICFGLSTGGDIGASIYHTRSGGTSYGDLMFATKPSSGGAVTERARITSAGKVGIKTDNPQEQLQVGDGAGTTGGLKVAGQSSSITDDGLTIDWTGSNEARLFSESSGNSTMKFYTTSSGTRGLRHFIQSNGNTDIYASQVHLYNSVDTSNTYFYAQNTGAGNAGIKMKNNQGEWTIIANDRLRFIDDDASLERLSITSGGTIRVGAANHDSSDIDASNTKLTIKQTANHMEDGIYIERSGERKGYYIRMNPSAGAGDALSFARNNSGTKSDVLSLDRDATTIIHGNINFKEDAIAGNNGMRYRTDSSGWHTYMQGGATNPGGTIRFGGGNADGDLRFYAQGATSTLAERMRIDDNGKIIVATGQLHSSRVLARFGIDCHGMDIYDGVGVVANYGMAFYNDPNSDKANGIGFFNDDGQTCGGYIVHQDKGGGNIGDIIIATSATSNSPVERLRISNSGHLIGDTTASNVPKLTLSNHDHGNQAFTHRGDRTLHSNGTGWDGNGSNDGADPILVCSVEDRAGNSDIGDALGLLLHSESQDDNDYGPLLAWSSRSNSGSYNSIYGAIVGQRTGQGTDHNWNAGSLHFFTAKAGSGNYMDSTANMTIDGAGHVLTPRNSRFYAVSNSGGSDTATNADGYVLSGQFETELVDSNQDYNTGNGRYTAPVDGKYEFHAAALLRALSSSGSGELTFYKNGSNISDRSYAYSHVGTGGSTGDHDHMHIHLIVALSAGDYVDFRVHDLNGGLDFYFSQGLGYFSGKLLG